MSQLTATAAPSGARAVEPAVMQITEFCQSILDMGGSPKSQEIMLRSASVALPPSAFLLLRYLELLSPLTVSQLADIVGLHPSTISSQLRPLTAKRLIRRTVDSGDRRVVALSITAAGRNICQRVLIAGAREWSVVLANWSKEDRRHLARLLKRAQADTFAVIEQRLGPEGIKGNP